jgi:hypothetical protein
MVMGEVPTVTAGVGMAAVASILRAAMLTPAEIVGVNMRAMAVISGAVTGAVVLMVGDPMAARAAATGTGTLSDTPTVGASTTAVARIGAPGCRVIDTATSGIPIAELATITGGANATETGARHPN